MEGFILVLLMLIHLCSGFNCTSGDHTCILWMKSSLGGQDACKAPKACFTADTACELLKDPCTDKAKRVCNLIRKMKRSDLLCGWKDEGTDPMEQKVAAEHRAKEEEKRRFEEERKREEAERRAAAAKEAVERMKEDAERRAAAARKRAKEEKERREREDAERREREEAARREREEEERREEEEKAREEAALKAVVAKKRAKDAADRKAKEEAAYRAALAKKEEEERRAREEEGRAREEAKRRAAAARKRARDAADQKAKEEKRAREEEKRRAKEEEARREEEERREEEKRRAKEEEGASANDTSILIESEGFISGFTLIEFLLVCVIMVLLSICCCCSINVFRRWCRRRMTLAGPFEGQHRTTTNCFSHCWRNAMITMQQRRLSSYLRKADALLENPAHTVYLHQYHEEVVESIYGKMGWSPVLASLGDNLSLRRGSVVRAHVHQEEAVGKGEEEGPIVEILAGKTGVANPHNIMDEPGVVVKQDVSKK